MKKGLTELVFVIDMSGSMFGLTDDTIGGFNATINRQREGEGEVLVSTVLFNTDTQVLHDRVDIGKVAPMTRRDYRPGGCTALIDALGGAIHHIANIHKYAREEDVPEHTMFVITTDGMENASRKYSSDRVKQMVEHEKSKYGWEFLFLGANIDAVETAARYGIDSSRTANYMNDAEGTALKFEAINTAVRCCLESAPMEGWQDDLEQDFRARRPKKEKR